jgi:hypothetical protein
MEPELVFNPQVDEEVRKRFTALFANLPANSVQASLEEFIDYYTEAVHGVSIMSTIRQVKHPAQGASVCIQTFAEGRALVVSSYGFKALSQTQCKCGKARLVLDEMDRTDMENDRTL